MTTTTQDLREQRANIWEQMKEVMDTASAAGRDLTAEESQKYDKAEKDMDALEERIARNDAHAAREKKFTSVDRGELPPEAHDEKGNVRADATPEYKEAYNNWMRFGSMDMDPEQRATLRAGQVDPAQVKAALGVGTGAAGGFTVPLEYRASVIERMKWVSSVRSEAENITTDSGVNLPWPTVDDTANIGAILGENTQVSQQDFAFGNNSLDAYMYTSKMVLLSLQLMQDSFFNFDKWMKKALGTRIGRIQNQHFTTGTGVNQPDGLVTGCTVAKVGAAGQVSTVTYEDLVDLADFLDPAYLGSETGNGNTQIKWMMSQAARKSIRKIKDGQNRPLWEPSVQAGVADTLLGHSVKLNNDMPAPGASAISLLFGDYEQAYIVRDVVDFFLVRFGERFMDSLQVGFMGYQRTDGTVQNRFAYAGYQHPAS